MPKVRTVSFPIKKKTPQIYSIAFLFVISPITVQHSNANPDSALIVSGQATETTADASAKYQSLTHKPAFHPVLSHF